MYYPLSQITTNLSTSNGEFILVGSRDEYTGNYFSTSDGKYYTGNTPQDGPNLTLVLNVEFNIQKDAEVGNMGTLDQNTSDIITLLPPSYVSSLSSEINFAPPPKQSSPYPTEENYKTGEFVRYFLKKTNTPLYIEVSKDTYTNYKDKNQNTQYQLYTTIKISWDLTGDPLNTYKVNKNIILLAQQQQNLLGFLFSFKGKYVKYYKPTPQNFFNTKGKELKIETTNENYIGFYHVNPNIGKIMEGKFHKPTFHNILIPIVEGEVVVKSSSLNKEVGTSIRQNITRNNQGNSGY